MLLEMRNIHLALLNGCSPDDCSFDFCGLFLCCLLDWCRQNCCSLAPALQAAVGTRVASTTASSPSTTSSAAGGSATANNMLTNGNFGTGDFSGWALYRLGNPTFAIQGDPNAYVS